MDRVLEERGFSSLISVHRLDSSVSCPNEGFNLQSPASMFNKKTTSGLDKQFKTDDDRVVIQGTGCRRHRCPLYKEYFCPLSVAASRRRHTFVIQLYLYTDGLSSTSSTHVGTTPPLTMFQPSSSYDQPKTVPSGW